MDNYFGERYGQPKAHLSVIVAEMPELLELEEFLYDIFNLHNRLVLILLSKYIPKDPFKTRKEYSLRYPRRYISKGGELELTKIEIGSPGLIDFKGLGDPIRALKEILEFILRYRQDRQSREVDLGIKETKLFREYRELGLTPDQISGLLKGRGLKSASKWVKEVRIEEKTGKKEGS